MHAEDGVAVESLSALAAGQPGPEAITLMRPRRLRPKRSIGPQLTAAEGVWLHLVHLSSRKGLRVVLQARANGVDYAETCIHYL